MIALNQRYSYQDICTSMQILSECYNDFTICRIVGTSQDDPDDSHDADGFRESESDLYSRHPWTGVSQPGADAPYDRGLCTRVPVPPEHRRL